MGLTLKRKMFIEYYLNDKETRFNGTQSAIKAGFKPHAANEQAARLLATANIKAIIEERIAEKIAQAKISKDEAITRANEIFKSCDSVDDKIKALRLLSELLDYFPKKSVDINNNMDVSGLVKEMLSTTVSTSAEQIANKI